MGGVHTFPTEWRDNVCGPLLSTVTYIVIKSRRKRRRLTETILHVEKERFAKLQAMRKYPLAPIVQNKSIDPIGQRNCHAAG